MLNKLNNLNDMMNKYSYRKVELEEVLETFLDTVNSIEDKKTRELVERRFMNEFIVERITLVDYLNKYEKGEVRLEELKDKYKEICKGTKSKEVVKIARKTIRRLEYKEREAYRIDKVLEIVESYKAYDIEGEDAIKVLNGLKQRYKGRVIKNIIEREVLEIRKEYFRDMDFISKYLNLYLNEEISLYSFIDNLELVAGFTSFRTVRNVALDMIDSYNGN